MGATLAASFDADAAIVYSGPENLTATASSMRTAFGDSSASVLVELGLSVPPLSFVASVGVLTPNSQFAAVRVGPSSPNAVYRPNLPGGGNGLEVQPGVVINSDEVSGFWTDTNPEVAFEFVSALSPGGQREGEWQDGDAKLIAFRVSPDGLDYNYGWVRLRLNTVSVDASGTNVASLTLVDWAYESDANTPIVAGAIPESSSLALLALGAVGVCSVRRRRVES